MQTISSAQASPEVPINENFSVLDHMATYGRKASTSTGLVFGYWGGTWSGFTLADGTLTLTANTTNYIVVLRSTGAISTSTAATNWDNTSNYARVYSVVTGAATVTSYADFRAGMNGVHGNASLQINDGIPFPATQVPSTNPNTLDDYEEGTFSPTVIGSTSAGVATYTNRAGAYTKIGNLVTFSFYVGWTAHTGTGNLQISGLPFPAQNTTDLIHSHAIGYPRNYSIAASSYLVAYQNPNESLINFRAAPIAGGLLVVVPIDTSADVAISGHYFV